MKALRKNFNHNTTTENNIMAKTDIFNFQGVDPNHPFLIVNVFNKLLNELKPLTPDYRLCFYDKKPSWLMWIDMWTIATNPYYQPGVQLKMTGQIFNKSLIKGGTITLQQATMNEERCPYTRANVKFKTDWKYMFHDMDNDEYKALAVNAFEYYVQRLPEITGMEVSNIIRDHKDSRLAWTANIHLPEGALSNV
jgi:hypothetical protein